jgi:two-component system, NtrC family, nitrogen regulation sensor histidine kinase NtrY
VRLDSAAGDLATLGQAFNQMTEQLHAQRNELVTANEQLDTRRRFTEAVLAGVTAGVFGLDSAGRITLVNRSAIRLLRIKSASSSGAPSPRRSKPCGRSTSRRWPSRPAPPRPR